MIVPQGTLWNGVRVITTQACLLLRLLTVAAFIAPAQMAPYALAGAILAAVTSFAEIGIRQQYIVTPRSASPHGALWTAWIVNLLSKTAMLSVAGIIGLIANFLYHTSTIAWLVIGAACAITAAAMANPATLELERRQRFKSIAILDSVSQAMGLITTVLVVIHTRSVWAMIIGAMVAGTTFATLSFCCIRPPPWSRPNTAAIRTMICAGKSFSVLAIMTFITASLDKLILGFFVPSNHLGSYYVAQRIGEAPMRLTAEIAARPLLTHYTKHVGRHAGHTLRQEEHVHLVFLLAGVLCAGAITAVIVMMTIHAGIKEEWVAALPLTIIFLGAYGARALCQIPAQLMLAMGHVSRDAKFKVQESLLTIVMLLPACWRYGTWGAAWVILLVYLASFLRRQWFITRVLTSSADPPRSS